MKMFRSHPKTSIRLQTRLLAGCFVAPHLQTTGMLVRRASHPAQNPPFRVIKGFLDGF